MTPDGQFPSVRAGSGRLQGHECSRGAELNRTDDIKQVAIDEDGEQHYYERAFAPAFQSLKQRLVGADTERPLTTGSPATQRHSIEEQCSQLVGPRGDQ